MNDAWIGLVGAGLGVLGTLLATGLVQWRAEVQRNKDREAETQRLAAQGDAEIERWERERKASQEDASQAHWTEQRRMLYTELQYKGLRALTSMADALGLRMAYAERDIAPVPDLDLTANAEYHDAAETVIFLASEVVIGRALSLSKALTNTGRLMKTRADLNEVEEALTEAGQHLSVLTLLTRTEMGAIAPFDRTGIRRAPEKDESATDA